MGEEGCEKTSNHHGRDLFPFASPRKGQDNFLCDARKALSSGQHLLAHAPTGLGKTAVALTASLEVGLESDLLVFFLTSRQSQHRIAVDTLRRISDIQGGIFSVDIISKQSLCPLSGSLHYSSFQDFCELRVSTRTCPYYEKSTEPLIEIIRKRILHVDEIAQLSRTFGRCPHKTAMDCFSEADVIVCDYNYLFSPIRDVVLEKAKRELEGLVIIVDEAHNLPARIRGHLRGEIGIQEILVAAKEAKKVGQGMANILVGLAKDLREQFDDEIQEVGREAILGPLQRSLKNRSSSVDDFVNDVKRCAERAVAKNIGTSLLELGDFLGGWMDEKNPILRVRNGENRKFSYVLLDPSILSHEVFERAHSSILMSGTLYPAVTYSDLLGIPKSRCIGRTYTSPFPRENRKVVSSTRMTSLFKRRGEKTYQAYANLILKVSSLFSGNLAAFFPSYEFLENVHNRMMLSECRKEVLVENQGSTKEEKNQMLERLKELRGDGGILLAVMGGSLSEGVDFRDNLLGAAIICGIPLTPPTVENEALRRYYSSRFGKRKGFDYSYLIPAMNKVLQAAGRCIRSGSDRAVVILADLRFLSERYLKFLPGEFHAREEDIECVMKDFFGTT
ncbi:MAG: ATP-dependent DNA helicase [Thermoplasmata archaeon]